MSSEEMDAIREQALDLVLPFASQYSPERYLYEIQESMDGVKLDPDYMTADGSCTAYCENCIADAVKSARKRYREQAKEKWDWYKQTKSDGFYVKDGMAVLVTAKQLADHRKHLAKEYRKGKLFGYEIYDVSCSETDDFELCDGCGVIFQEACLLSEQEVEHWETQVEFTKENCCDPYQAYQLSKIFDGEPWAHGRREQVEFNLEMENRVTALAHKVIEAFAN